jgi:transcriptional regulator with XRE-family HTH domain
MRPNELIRKAREQLGLSELEIAAHTGISISAYGDVEQYPDEFSTVLSLAEARRLCAALHLALTHVASMELGDGGNLGHGDFEHPQARSILLRTRRQALHMSAEELGDIIGFDSAAIERAESDSEYLETLSIQVLSELARALKLPWRTLIE